MSTLIDYFPDIDPINLVFLMIALVSAFAALRSYGMSKIISEQQQAAHNLSTIRNFLFGDYAERGFRLSEAPIINDKKVELLRKAQNIALKEYEEDPDKWAEISKWTEEPPYTWQSTVAYETAISLETMGAAAFTGVVPLRLLLSIIGSSIVEDWLLCRTWVDTFRQSTGYRSPRATPDSRSVDWSRRHAEWLALVATLWMIRYWSSFAHSYLLIELYGGEEALKARIQDLYRADERLMPKNVQVEVKRITGFKMRS